MKIACVSDMHGMLGCHHLPEADVLVIAGDYMPNFPQRGRGSVYECEGQLEWLKTRFIPLLSATKCSKILLVAGNHDWCHQDPTTASSARATIADAGFVYLEDEAYEYGGFKFWGSPWQPHFFSWAYNFSEYDPLSGYQQAKRTWAKIPKIGR